MKSLLLISFIELNNSTKLINYFLGYLYDFFKQKNIISKEFLTKKFLY
jgi:hypothetical protein